MFCSQRRLPLVMLVVALCVWPFPPQIIGARSNCENAHCINLPLTAKMPDVFVGRHGSHLNAPQQGGGTIIWGEILNNAKHAIYNVKVEVVLRSNTFGYTETKTLNLTPVSFVVPSGGSSPIKDVYPQSGIDYRLKSMRVLTWTEDISGTYGIASTHVQVNRPVATITVRNDLTTTMVISQTTMWDMWDYDLDLYVLNRPNTMLEPGQAITLSQVLWHYYDAKADQLSTIAYGAFVR